MPGSEIKKEKMTDISTQNDVLNFWLYALDKLSRDLVEDGSLVELAADIVVDRLLSQWGIKWRLFDSAFDACSWYLNEKKVKSFIGDDSVRLSNKEEGIIEAHVAPGCPYAGHGFWVCKRAAVLLAIIKRCTGMDYAYELKAKTSRGCFFILCPSKEKYQNFFTKKQVIRLIQTFTEEAEIVNPGLIERTGRSFAQGLQGNLEQGLAEFRRTGLGTLNLENINLEKNRALFVGQELLQGSAGQSEVAVDSFTKGFISGLVGRLTGVDVNCEEMTCTAKGDERCTFVLDTAREDERQYLRKIIQVTPKIGYTPSFHNLALLAAGELGLLKSRYVDFELKRFFTWQEMSESLQAGGLDGAIIQLPLAFHLRQEGVPIKLVSLGHREGLGLVIPMDSFYEKPEDLFYKAPLLAVAHKYSSHNVLLHKWLRDLQLESYIELLKTVSVPTPLMLKNLGYGEVDGFLGPEPYITEAEFRDKGKELALSRDIWPGHICCVLVLTIQFLNENPGEAAQLVNGIRQAGQQLHNDQKLSRRVAKKYFGLPGEWTASIFGNNRISFDNLEPDMAQIEAFHEIMLEMGLLPERISIDEFVDRGLWSSLCVEGK